MEKMKLIEAGKSTPFVNYFFQYLKVEINDNDRGF